MNPSFRAEILGMTTEELAERNGAGLLAQQLQSAALANEADIARHAAEVRAYIAANRGGLAVYWLAHEARRQGRKMLRVADILDAMESEQTLNPAQISTATPDATRGNA